MAVLAVAFAGAIVLADEVQQADADTSVSSVTINTTDIGLYIGQDEASFVETDISVTIEGTELTVGMEVTAVSSNTEVAASPATVTLTTGGTSETVTLKVTPLTTAGSTTITVTCGEKSDTMEITVVQPTITIGVTEIVQRGTADFNVPITVNAKAGNYVFTPTISGSNIAKSTETTTVSTVNFNEPVTQNATFTVSEAGAATITIPNSATAVSGYTPVVIPVCIYDTSADAVVVGYSEIADATGEHKIQAIYYSDATVLISLANSGLTRTTHIDVTSTYNSGTPITTTVATADKVWIDLAGQYMGDISKIEITLAPYDSDETAKLGSLTTAGAATAFTKASIKFDARSVGSISGLFPGQTEYALLTNVEGLETLGKLDTLSEEFVTAITPTLEGYEFVGFNIVAGDSALATTALLKPATSVTTEEFLFALGNGDDSNKLYAVWTQGISNIFITDKTVAGIQNEASFVAAGTYDADGTFTMYAPSVATQKDIVLVRIINNDATKSFTYVPHVYAADAAGVKTAEDLTDVVTIDVLANGMFAISGITKDVVIYAVATQSTTLNTGYDLSVVSVINTANVGEAIAKLDFFDAAVTGNLSMGGTYYKALGDYRIFGNIENLASGALTYTAIADNEDATAEVTTDGELALDPDAVGFTLKMTSTATTGNDVIGFYAVKAVYGSAATQYTLGTYASS